jgi:hypothetical protein
MAAIQNGCVFWRVRAAITLLLVIPAKAGIQ